MMESTDAGLHLLRVSEADPMPSWDAAAKYRELLQHQQRLARECLEEDNMSSDGASGSASPRGTSDGIADEISDDVSDKDNSVNKETCETDFRLDTDVPSSAATLAALQRQSLLAAAATSLRHHPASMVAQPSLDFSRPGLPYLRDASSPPLSSPPSPASARQRAAGSPTSSTGGCDRGASAASSGAPWNYEEQFKQLYDIDDNPKRKEFLDELFQFMQNRGTPINRLPIMAKQVLDLFELFNLVVARGGLVEVINKKLWQEIIKGLKLPSSITSAAFTLRTQYMKYLYPQECNKVNLSSPNELQAAIDGNRREGRRSNFSGGGAGGAGANGVPGSYADLVNNSPFLACHMGSTFGLPGGLAGGLHQSAITPISLATSRAGFSGPLGHPIPPSAGAPFLAGLGAPMMPTTNDTLLTLWNMYNKQQQHQQQQQQLTPSSQANTPLKLDQLAMLHQQQQQQQAEALNLGVRKDDIRIKDSSELSDLASRTRISDQFASESTEVASGLSSDHHHQQQQQQEMLSHLTRHHSSSQLADDSGHTTGQQRRARESSSPLDFCRRRAAAGSGGVGGDGNQQPEVKRQRTEEESPTRVPLSSSTKTETMSHTKMKIDSKDDGSLLVSMEIRGCLYQGVLFAQQRNE